MRFPINIPARQVSWALLAGGGVATGWLVANQTSKVVGGRYVKQYLEEDRQEIARRGHKALERGTGAVGEAAASFGALGGFLATGVGGAILLTDGGRAALKAGNGVSPYALIGVGLAALGVGILTGAARAHNDVDGATVRSD